MAEKLTDLQPIKLTDLQPIDESPPKILATRQWFENKIRETAKSPISSTDVLKGEGQGLLDVGKGLLWTPASGLMDAVRGAWENRTPERSRANQKAQLESWKKEYKDFTTDPYGYLLRAAPRGLGQAAGVALTAKIPGTVNTVKGWTKPLSLDEMMSTSPEKISDLIGMKGKVADVHSLMGSAEKAARAQAKAAFPTIENPIEIKVDGPERELVGEGESQHWQPVKVVKQVTFKKLQEQYSELGMKISREKEAVMNGKARFDLEDLVKQRKGVNGLMTKAAESEEKLDSLEAARKQWAQFEDDFHNPNSPIRRVLKLKPDQTIEIVNHLKGGTNAARATEILKRNGIDPSAITRLTGRGAKPLAVDVSEAAKLRTQGSPQAYRNQRILESLRQATTNEIPTGSQARLPAWSMRKTFPGLPGEIIGVSPRGITTWRIRRLARQLGLIP